MSIVEQVKGKKSLTTSQWAENHSGLCEEGAYC